MAGVFVVGLARPAMAEYCAVKVQVNGSNREPVKTIVVLRGHDSRIQTTVTSAGGAADFCDVGFDLFEIVVGPDLCGQVIVRHLSAVYPETRQVVVTYDGCHRNIPSFGCLALLRVVGPDRRVVEGARFDYDDQHQSSDRLGRIYTYLRFHSLRSGTIVADGYGKRRVDIRCTPEQTYMEYAIELSRTPDARSREN